MKKLLQHAMLLCALLCTMSLSAKQYCREVLISGDNQIQLTCQKVSEGNYQIIIEGENLQGMGGSFLNVNGVGGYDIKTNMIVADDKKSLTFNIASTSDPSFYTPLYVLMPGEVNFGDITDIEWGTCEMGETPKPEEPIEPEEPETPEEPEFVSSCSGDKGHFAPADAVKRFHYEISYSNGDVIFTATALNDKILDFAEIQITNVGNYAMPIADGVATYTLSGRTIGEKLYIRFLYSDSEIGGNEMTAETQAETDANIITYKVGDCVEGEDIEEPTPEPEKPTTNGPTTSAPTPPTYDAGKVIAIYSDVNNAIAGFNPNPGWGQATQYEAFKIGEDNILKYSNLNYQGVEFSDQNCAAMEYVHVDIFCDNDVTVEFFPINHNPQQEQGTALTVKGGQWNSFDVKLADFTIQFNAIWQFKFVATGNPTIYVDNIYFYTTSTAVDTEAPTNVTAIVGNVTYNSVQLKLNATDACGAVVYEISYNGGTATASGASATELLYEVTGLQGSTDYTFSIVAKDLTGNAAEAITVSTTTLADLAVPTTAAPAPTVAADKVWSLYSDVYKSPTWFNQGWWGQTTVYSTMTIAGDNVMKFEKFDYLGLEIANNAPQDLSAYTHLHFDVWTPNAADIEVTPIGGGENLKKVELEKETWNSFDIALTEFPNVDASKIIQIKFAGGDKSEIFYIDNIYFVKIENGPATNSSAILNNSFGVYPVPATDIISLASEETIVYVDILNVLGQVVYSSDDVETTINISALTAGQYIVRAIDENGIIKTVKFVKK